MRSGIPNVSAQSHHKVRPWSELVIILPPSLRHSPPDRQAALVSASCLSPPLRAVASSPSTPAPVVSAAPSGKVVSRPWFLHSCDCLQTFFSVLAVSRSLSAVDLSIFHLHIDALTRSESTVEDFCSKCCETQSGN